MLNASQALDLLNEIVAEKGEDFVYTAPQDGNGSCVYWNNGPSCIVGHLLFRAGVDPAKIQALDFNAPAEPGLISGTNASDIPKYIEDAMTWEAARLCNEVQHLQDGGTSWGDAVKIGVRDWIELSEDFGSDQVVEVAQKIGHPLEEK